MSKGSTLIRSLTRASAVAALFALFTLRGAMILAAEPSQQDSNATKKPAAAAKSGSSKAPATKTKSTATKPPAKGATTKKGLPPSVVCQPTANYVEPVCSSQQAAGQKFNTFEDIYSPPVKPQGSAPPPDEGAPPAPAEPPPPPPKSE